jgi:pyrrolidone-carboxylate peptidase
LTGSNPYKENNNNNNKNTINALSEKRLKTIKIMMFYEKKTAE